MSLQHSFKDVYSKDFSMISTPVWHRIKLPENLFPLTDIEFNNKAVENTEKHFLSSFDNLNEDMLKIYEKIDLLTQANHRGLGDKFNKYTKGYSNDNYLIHFKKSNENPIKINYVLSDSNTQLLSHQMILIEAGVEANLEINYTSDGKLEKQVYIHLQIVVLHGGKLTISKVQSINDKDIYFDESTTYLEEGAKIIYNDIQLGSKLKAISNTIILHGRHSEAITNAIYYSSPLTQTDVSYRMIHQGKKTNSQILAKGALEKDSKKVFRGDLIFDRGSTSSVGKEGEFVILLDKSVKSDSLPALMCSEDDVIGEHAASIGTLDEKKLFYLMSRGFSMVEAKKLVIKASFEEIIGKIKSTTQKEMIRKSLIRRIDNERL